MRIALLPLDERPVNTALPQAVAAIAGATATLPDAGLLPRQRVAGQPDALAGWLAEMATDADALVVSLDMLGYGGLIPSRTSDDTFEAVTSRLAVLERIRSARPDLPVSAVTTVMRASNSYNAAEEPEYWTSHGADIHRLGANLHRAFLAEPTEEPDGAKVVPDDVRRDFLRRRLRNHTADLYAIGLAERGVVAPLLITADDTAERAAGSLEQVWLRQWTAALQLDGSVLSYPGADEVGAVLVARMLAARLATPPRLAMLIPEPGGASRVANFENVPIATTVANQIRAAGGVLAESGSADATVVVHAPDPARRDAAGHRPSTVETPAVAAVVDAVERLVAAGERVGVADVRYSNGGDPALVAALVRRGLLAGPATITAYGGWNTAGNTVGSVVAPLVAYVAGTALGTLDEAAATRLRLHRLVEDYGYQTVVRGRLLAEFPPGRMSPGFADTDAGREEEQRYLAACGPQLAEILTEVGGEGWELADFRLPWRRGFEIDFAVRAGA